MEHSSDVFMVIDEAGNVSDVSPSIVYVLGYDTAACPRFVDDLVDDPTASVRTRSSKPRGRAPVASPSGPSCASATRRARTLVRGRRHDRLDDPSVQGLVCNMRDVTERKGVEAELEHRGTTTS